MMSQAQNNWPFVINVSNSIIGVTILAMPFCFKMCGIVLGCLMLAFATWLTLTSCHLLMKAGVTSRRRSYEFLAYYTHGVTGKLTVEIGMIGLQIGTLVAQVVIIGDLGPNIVSKATGLENTDHLRTGLIVFLCLFIGLPLGLLKDVRTLSKTSTMCVVFYAGFAFYIVVQSLPSLLEGEWIKKVNIWRTEGFFQCLPIFSFAFGCQTQLFIVYDALSEPSLKRINSIVSSAVNLCTLGYLLVGFFGYVAFCDEAELSGDIINHLKEDAISDGIKLCFVFSIAVSIPLIVFPCRASLYTLLFPQKPKEDLPGSGKIPEFHFRLITVVIISGAMIIGILVPNVEFVLALNGATMGTLICYIFPALFFLNVMANTLEGKAKAKMVLFFGLSILIVCTYMTLNTQDKVKGVENEVIPIDIPDKIQPPAIQEEVKNLDINNNPVDDVKDSLFKNKVIDTGQEEKEGRQEPPNPQAPEEKQGNKSVKIIPVEVEKDPVVKAADTEKDKPDMIKSDELKAGNGKQEERKEIVGKKQEEILEKLEQQQEEQKKLIEEQKQILQELKQHKEEHKEEKPKDSNAVPAEKKQDMNAGPNLQQPAGKDQIQRGIQVQGEGGQKEILVGNQRGQKLPPVQEVKREAQIGQQALQGGQQEVQNSQQLLHGDQQPVQGDQAQDAEQPVKDTKQAQEVNVDQSVQQQNVIIDKLGRQASQDIQPVHNAVAGKVQEVEAAVGHPPLGADGQSPVKDSRQQDRAVGSLKKDRIEGHEKELAVGVRDVDTVQLGDQKNKNAVQNLDSLKNNIRAADSGNTDNQQRGDRPASKNLKDKPVDNAADTDLKKRMRRSVADTGTQFHASKEMEVQDLQGKFINADDVNAQQSFDENQENAYLPSQDKDTKPAIEIGIEGKHITSNKIEEGERNEKDNSLDAPLNDGKPILKEQRELKVFEESVGETENDKLTYKGEHVVDYVDEVGESLTNKIHGDLKEGPVAMQFDTAMKP